MASPLCRSSSSVEAATLIIFVLKNSRSKTKSPRNQVSGAWASELFDYVTAKSGNSSGQRWVSCDTQRFARRDNTSSGYRSSSTKGYFPCQALVKRVGPAKFRYIAFRK